MPKASRPTSPLPSLPRLLTALEARLEALTTGLEQVDVTGKGLDLIKEIKELHAILDNLREDNTAKAPPTLTVVWGDTHASSSHTSPPRGTGHRSATPDAKAARAKATHADKTKAQNTATPTSIPTSTPKVIKHA